MERAEIMLAVLSVGVLVSVLASTPGVALRLLTFAIGERRVRS